MDTSNELVTSVDHFHIQYNRRAWTWRQKFSMVWWVFTGRGAVNVGSGATIYIAGHGSTCKYCGMVCPERAQ